MSCLEIAEARIKELKNMTINMEVKKTKLEQLGNGDWKLTVTIHHEDMSMELVKAAMGSPYGMALVPIKYDDTPPNLDHFTTEIRGVNPCAARVDTAGETAGYQKVKSEGEKLLAIAHIRCKEEI